ncbi:low molecular weight protein tyrosine phosphatase family protein [Paenibacillus chungangensis]|uniref:Low molecular weight protein tyrosine phosphatase family protein n=1 Tax=Paenibacillus chungangensis TaxID=696535 RepID=A0ABW3HNN0_9BACL
MKVLFICSKNKWRSLTAEKIFERNHNFHVRSAGTENGARMKVNSGHIGWADVIFVMEKKHERRLQQKFGQELYGKKMIRLDIPDDYSYMDEELIEMLTNRVFEYIEID